MKTKTFTLSKQEVEYLQPVNATMNALTTAINVYFVNVVFRRLGIQPNAQAQYNLEKGELTVAEPEEPAKEGVADGQPTEPAGAGEPTPAAEPATDKPATN